jgi:hypothetical protein
MLEELKADVLEYFDWEFKERRRGQHFLGREGGGGGEGGLRLSRYIICKKGRGRGIIMC